MYFVKRISINNFLIFEVVKKSFEGCYFSLYCFGLVALVEMRYIVFQHIRSYSLNGYGMELLRKTVLNLSYMHSRFSGLISFDIDKMLYILQKRFVGCS